MIPDSLTVLQLQELRNQLTRDIQQLLHEFVQRTGVIVRVDPCTAGPRFPHEGVGVAIDVAVYTGLSDGLEQIGRKKSPPAGRS